MLGDTFGGLRFAFTGAGTNFDNYNIVLTYFGNIVFVK